MSKVPTAFAAVRERRSAAWGSLRLHSLSLRSNDAKDQADLEVALRDYLDRRTQEAAVAEAVARQEGSPYRPDSRHSFFRDLWAADLDSGARARLKTHESAVADQLVLEGRSTTSAFGALVVPQYLLELAATGTRWNRPLADTLARPLTEEGMSVELARISTDADAEVQATQNTALTGTTPAASSVTVPVRTVPIRTTTSRQFLERAEAGSDFLFAQELMAAHDAKVEQLLLNGSGASGEPTGLLNTSGVASVTFTSATPTLTEFLTKVAAAITTATANRGIAPDTLVVHPRRWAYNLARAEQTNTAAVSGVSRPGAPPTAVGSCLGLDVVMSAAVPTTLSSTQDVALVGRRSDWVYLETPPFTHLDADFTSSNSLQIAYRAYRYVAVDGSRYADGSVKVTGTGMAAVAS